MSAATSAGVVHEAPRAQFTRNAPFFIRPNRAAFRRPVVSGVTGV